MTIKEKENPKVLKSIYQLEFSVKFDREIMTIGEYLEKLEPLVDCNPIGQRPPIHEKDENEKSVGIVQTIFDNYDLGIIILVNVKDEPSQWQWESIDGGHRKRAIKSYVEGKFRVNGKYYSELTDEERKHFRNYKLCFSFYQPLPNEVKGIIFRRINNTTNVNNQETLNSFGNIPIANMIREIVRSISYNGKITEPHQLFEKTSGGENFKYFQSQVNNVRLVLEEFVARFCYRLYVGGDIGSRKYNELLEMYSDKTLDSSKTSKLHKKLNKLLDFLLEMAKARKDILGNGLGKKEMNTLANFYLYLNYNHGDWKLPDPMEFYRAFSIIYNDYSTDPDEKYKEIAKFSFENNELSIKQCFIEYTSNYDSYEKQLQLMKWITTDFDVTQYITFTDKTRCFPRWMKETTLQKQNYKCAIDGLELKWEDAEAAHITSYSDGGKTILSNCAMVRKKHNQAMGTMSVTEYKKMIDKSE